MTEAAMELLVETHLDAWTETLREQLTREYATRGTADGDSQIEETLDPDSLELEELGPHSMTLEWTYTVRNSQSCVHEGRWEDLFRRLTVAVSETGKLELEGINWEEEKASDPSRW